MNAIELKARPAAAPGLTVKVARTYPDLMEVRDHWEAMRFGHPDADFDVFATVLANRAEIIRPHVVVLEHDGEPLGMVAARLEERAFSARFGYATPFRPKLHCLTVVNGGVAGPASATAMLIDELLESLRRGEAQAALLQKVPLDTPVYTQTLGRSRRFCRQPFRVPAKHWVCDLPASFDDFLPSLPKSVRDNFKRYSRRLAKQYGERLQVKRLEFPGDLETALRDLEAVAATTYQRGLHAGFQAERDRPLIELGLEQGWFRTWILYIDGAPCAFEIGRLYDNALVIEAKGYDPSWARQHVGKYLQLRLIEDLCADDEVSVLDFGFGDADYKRRLATRSWEETDVLIYAATPRAMAVNARLSAVAGLDVLGRRAVGPERLTKIKRRWRTLRTPASD